MYDGHIKIFEILSLLLLSQRMSDCHNLSLYTFITTHRCEIIIITAYFHVCYFTCFYITEFILGKISRTKLSVNQCDFADLNESHNLFMHRSATKSADIFSSEGYHPFVPNSIVIDIGKHHSLLFP